MVDFLHTEGDKHRKALRCEGTQGINLPYPERQGGIQTVHLLIFQHRKLAEMLSRCREQGFGIIVKLLFGVCGMHHRQHRKHHPLVTGRQIVKELLAFPPLLFQVVGDNSGKIIVLVLLPLPVRDIRFHPKQAVFHLTHGFVRRDGDNINGEHHITVKLAKLRHHAVLDISGVLSEENHTPVSVAHLEIILLKLKGVGADIVLEIVTFPHGLHHIKGKRRFLARAVEVMEDTQLIICVQFRTLRAKTVEMPDKVSTDTGKIIPRFLDVLLAYRYRHIFVLHDGISPRRLVKQHLVVLLTVLIQTVLRHWDKDCLLKIRLVEPAVIDSDFRGRPAVEGV